MADAAPDERLLRLVQDGQQAWKIQDTGMEILRRMKHESIAFDRNKLVSQTDDRNGSKFLANWTLLRIVRWCIEQCGIVDPLTGPPWRFPPGANQRIKIPVGEPVGYVRGKLVHTITVVARGRYVHAYPDED